MYFDGVVNLTGSRTRVVLISPTGQHYLVAAKLVFPCTNNISEYEACIWGYSWPSTWKLGIYKSMVIPLSSFCKQRMADSWPQIPYYEFLEELIKEFDEVIFEYLPRSLNQFVDAFATLSSMLQVTGGLDIEPLKIEILRHLAYCMVIADEPDERPWYYDIRNYLQKGEFPQGSELTD